MKILFTITYYLPYVSGLTIHVARIAQSLCQKEDVQVLASCHDKNLALESTIEGVQVTRVPYLFKVSKGFIMPLFAYHAFRMIKNVDAVVVNLPQFEGFIAATIARVLGKRVFCIYHCEVTLPKSYINLLTQKLLDLANLISLQFAHKIITYTKDYADHSRLLPKFKHKLFFNYPPIPKPVVDKKYYTKLQKNLPKKKYIIGVAARLAAEKGVEYLLEAIPLLDKKLKGDFVIIFAGPLEPVGEKRYWQEIEPQLAKYENYIKFTGTIPPDKMGSFYKLLDILVLPSINSTEAFGMVQVEAMMMGVPVVVSDLPGVRVPIKKTGMGKIVPARNSQKLAEAIVAVLKNKLRYIKDANLIEKEFGYQKTMKFYEQVIR